VSPIPRAVRIGLLLTPALAVVVLLFGGGLAQAVAQSLGYQPFLSPRPLGLGAYRALVADPAVRASVGLTLRVGVVSTGLATVLGSRWRCWCGRSGGAAASSARCCR